MEFLIFDVGGSAIKYAIINEKAEFIKKDKIPTPSHKIESFIDAIGNIYDKNKERISGIALSLPGIIDTERGYALTGGHLRYNDDTEIVSILQNRCPVHITIENDGKCAALAEVWLGNLQDCDDAMVVVLGTGIGGAIIKDKKLHKGKHFSAGEFSLISTNTSTKGIYSNLWSKQAGSKALCSSVAIAKNLPLEEVNGYKVFEYANNGDEEVLKILDDYCYKLAIQLFNLQLIYDPEKIAIGGGISQQDILIDYINKNIEKYTENVPLSFPRPKIVRCKFLNDSNLIGALYTHLKKYNFL